MSERLPEERCVHCGRVVFTDWLSWGGGGSSLRWLHDNDGSYFCDRYEPGHANEERVATAGYAH